jgi:hypothetical protein
MDILVFKTSVTRKKHVKLLGTALDAWGRWSFDLEDCDHILRVEANHVAQSEIIRLLARYGFHCEELL